MQISELHIYPVKSLGGISLQEATLTAKGLKYDRNWMLLDETGRFMTQRDHPMMTMINTRIADGHLHFKDSRTEETASIPINNKYGENIKTKVWSTSCEVQKVDGIGEWFTKQLGFKCNLVYFPKENIRTKETELGIEQRITSLADKSPILLTNEASLLELNNRLEQKIRMNRFRANLIVQGDHPYQEDEWTKLNINQILLHKVENCGRCKLINVDQSTGKSHVEPLQTLSTYRKMEREIKFGIRLACETLHDQQAEIKVGDQIQVI